MAGDRPNIWLLGARPKTLPAAVVPVAVGTAVVAAEGGSIIWWRAICALVVSLALQVGTNYANDYSDGIRGTDDGDRVGPPRLVGSGMASPGAVKGAALLAFAVAALAGGALALAVGWELFVVGLVCLAAGWYYTGGSSPYGYRGLGEVSVFVFFGLVATAGSSYVHLDRLTGLAVLVSLPVGFLITALLVVNNLRDIPGDTVAGKNTLAVRLGDTRTRALYNGLVGASLALVPLVAFLAGAFGPLLALGAAGIAFGAVRVVASGAAGRALIPVLGATGRLTLVFGVLFAVGLAL